MVNFVIGGGNTSRHSVKSLVGFELREQVVFVDDLINSWTSVSERRRNSEKEGPSSAKWDSLTSEVLPWRAISSQMELILSRKNLPKSLAINLLRSECRGRLAHFDRLSSDLHAVNSFLWLRQFSTKFFNYIQNSKVHAFLGSSTTNKRN